MQGQIELVTKEPFKIKNKVRLIELFAGVGSQAMALRDIGADFEHYRVVEFDKYAIASYNAIHGTSFPTSDITQITGKDLGIEDTEHFTYLLTHFLARTFRWPDARKATKRDLEQDLPFCGRCAGFWMNFIKLAMACHRYS